jgi:hypothetical protein
MCVVALRIVNRIFGFRPRDVKPPSDSASQRIRRYRRSRHTIRKRTAALTLLFASLFSVAIAERSLLAVGSSDAVKNPLGLLGDRSPGERGSGALLLTKSKPHERVLSSVRTRNPAGADNPGSADAAPGEPFESEGAGTSGSGPSSGLGPIDQFAGVPFLPASYPVNSRPPATTPGSPGSPIAAPEPATWALMLFGLFAVTGIRRHRSKGIA